jgi:hypothetical protein
MVHFSVDMSMEDIIKKIDAHADGKEYVAPAGIAFLQYKVAQKQIETQLMWNQTLDKLSDIVDTSSKQSDKIAKRLVCATWALVASTLFLALFTLASFLNTR